MTLRWYNLVVECKDPARLAEFWSRALGWRTAYASDTDVGIEPCDDADDRVPALVFWRTENPRRGKNRLHLDLHPQDQAAEVARLRKLGASLVDVGQDADVDWVVLADPEGNEFCVLSGS